MADAENISPMEKKIIRQVQRWDPDFHLKEFSSWLQILLMHNPFPNTCSNQSKNPATKIDTHIFVIRLTQCLLDLSTPKYMNLKE